MPSFYSGRRFCCVGGLLLALYLGASIAANAQSGSSPQSRPAQPAGAGSGEQTPAQGAPPCSNAPPIMKRGPQADLPPCPEPPPEESQPPARNPAPARSLSPSEALIEKAREVAFEFSENLPNYICDVVMSRYRQEGREETPLDVVSAEIIYDNKQESYRNVKVNDRPTDTPLEEVGGAWSTGEFASTLLSLFAPDTNAQFHYGGVSPLSGANAEVYDFQVRRENSRWTIHIDNQTLVPAYEGSVWVDPKTARVLRIEMQASNIPADFPMDTIESAVDYSNVFIGGNSVLLPVHAESLGCQRGVSECSHNKIDFRNYHEFKVDVKIGN